MSEEELREHFDIPPVSKGSIMDDNDWENWAGNIEIRLSRQGQYIVGLGAGLLATLLLMGLQGKIVINLVNTQRQIVGAINTLVENGGAEPQPSAKRYSTPSGAVNETEVTPPNPEEVEELQELMRKSNNGELPTFKE